MPVWVVLWSGVTEVGQVEFQQRYVPKKWVPGFLTTWIPSMTRFFPLMDVFLPWLHGEYSKMTTDLPPRSPDLNPSENLWRKLYPAAHSFIINTRSCRVINATLDRNKCCDIAYTLLKTMRAVIKDKGGPTKISRAWCLLQCSIFQQSKYMYKLYVNANVIIIVN